MRQVFIDPPSKAFYENRFFMDSELNRDDCLRPYITLKEKLGEQGVEVNTFDLWDQRSPMDYYSFGMLDHLDEVSNHPSVNMKAFYVFEPPIVDPSIYNVLPKLTDIFQEVYVHNTHGDGYSLKGINTSKLRKLFWPQPFDHVLEPCWGRTDRENKVVVINGNHKPKSRVGELYSTRIEAMAELSKLDVVDLYGGGWDKWCSRSSLWMPYWRNRKALNTIYQGRCESKHETLSRYRFCLCFENMNMSGLVTEKIFDSLYAGTIPLYLGAPDIETMVPTEAYIDCRDYKSWTEMWVEVSRMSDEQINEIRMSGKDFLESKAFLKYYNALTDQLISSFEPASE